MREIKSNSKGNALAQTSATLYHAQFELSDKDHAIKWLVVCKTYDVNTFGPAKWSVLNFLLSVQ